MTPVRICDFQLYIKQPDTKSSIKHSNVGLVDVILRYCLVCSCKFHALDVTIVIMHVICKKTHILSNDTQSCNIWATKYQIFLSS